MDYLVAVVHMKKNNSTTGGTTTTTTTTTVAANPSMILVGHSEGTILSALASQERPNIVKSLVLICPFVTPLDELMRRQAQEVDEMLQAATGRNGWLKRKLSNFLTGGSVETFQNKLIERIKESDTPSIRFMMTKRPALWFREHFAMDYEAIYRKVTVSSTLILVAEYDVQCDPNDGERIKTILDCNNNNNNNKGNHSLHSIAKLSHLLRRGDEKGFAGYGKQMKMEMEGDVVTTVVEYCLQVLDKSSRSGSNSEASTILDAVNRSLIESPLNE
jgi:hypothetical protein